MNLRAGMYFIVETPPDDYLDGKEVAGEIGGTVNNDVDSNEIRDIVVVDDPGTTPDARVRDDLIDFSDFLPTVAELAGARLAESVPLDGHSFAAQLIGQTGSPRRWVFCEHGGRQWARTKRWKLYSDNRLIRPRASYVGPLQRPYVPIGER